MTLPFEHLDDDDREAALSILRVEIARRRRRAAAIKALTKHCPTCDTDLPTSDFASDASRHDGLRGQCRDCGRKARARKAESE